MSTRVQKGGTVFKPVAKGRPRAPTDNARRTSTQTPAPKDTPSTASSSAQPVASSSTNAHEHVQGPTQSSSSEPSNAPYPTPVPSLPHATTAQVSIPNPAPQLLEPPSLPPHAIPVYTPATPISSGTVRATPITIGKRQPSMGPPRVTPTAPPASHPAQNDPFPTPPSSLPSIQAGPPPIPPQSEPAQTPVATPLPIPDLSNPNLQFDTSPLPPLPHQSELSHPHDLGDIQSSDAQRLRLNSDSVVKPSRPSRRKGSTTETADNGESSEKGSRKRTRSKKAIAAAETDGQVEGQVEGTQEKPRRKKVNARKAIEEGAEEEPSQPKKRRRKSAAPRERKESAPPFSADAEPGEDLDPTVITMANLCDDTGQGRVSSKASHIFDNHAAWKQSNKERRARMRAVTEAKKYGRDEEDIDDGRPAAASSSQPATNAPSTSKQPTPESSQPPAENTIEGDEGGKDDSAQFDYSQSLDTSRFTVQVRIGPNGETIVDEESLFVDRAEENETENYVHVEESDATKFVNSASYGKKAGGSRWSGMETELFYEALSQFGENYELISYVMPGRDRKACKNKFKAEDKKNPARIQYCLDHRVPYDMQTLSRMTGKDFSGPTPEIRAPTRPNLSQLDGQEADGSGPAAGTSGDGASTPAKSSTPGPSRPSSGKKSKKTQNDGVEVLGSIDNDEWDG
ncbi:uncharacterized protein STEHIDRAFT_151579 [Stereum hirsutum FP-91666 SS1]|uniref:uncharacterized protein n=1 Tax=Stereum hirsutum (strain FP-91666) TaxID=721885 RepID=UPI000440A9D9|nr:uncharacterized protein STEHIDRAFT_151579 [Stereum hirsutum FP-91666 SS1]EIM92243.1 hypothetical protein STEHIDRAFT_151579 [Stereum hirsutum FP-91666 SS1]